MKSILLILSTLSLVLCDKPEFKCTLSGTVCTFNTIRLNLTHHEWQPTSDDPTVVRTLTFTNCIIPVVAKDICKTFPMITTLNMANQGVEVVHEDAFFDCRRLESIDLQSNKIEKLGKQTFYYTTEVHTLFLHNNKLRNLDDYSIFENMSKLRMLYVASTNITNFSPELIRNNKQLQQLYIFSNELLDVDAEKIVELLPNLTVFELDDNEISCARLVEIVKLLISKGITYGTGRSYKVRFYATQNVYGGLKCSPDASWMAADYRVENSKFDQRFQEMERELLTNVDQRDKGMERKLYELNAKIDKIEKMFSKWVKGSERQ